MTAKDVARAQEASTLASTGSAAASNGPRPAAYQPPAPIAAAGSGDPEASAPEHAQGGTDAATAFQGGVSGNAAADRPPARRYTKQELHRLSQRAHGVQQQMSELLTQRRPGVHR